LWHFLWDRVARTLIAWDLSLWLRSCNWHTIKMFNASKRIFLSILRR
jgi:hypothetical protein